MTKILDSNIPYDGRLNTSKENFQDSLKWADITQAA